MQHATLRAKIFTWPALVLALLMAAGAIAVVYRMMYGLGASTNLTDNWPWGLWKGFNVICLIALAAGGFSSAAIIYFLGGESLHGFARSAVLWAILGYGFAGASLAVDIGIPWRIINPIYMWPKQSILFEVAWCVMLYLTVLALELAPAIFERFGWMRLHDLWKKMSPWYSVAALSFFAYVMSHSVAWAVAAFVLFTVIALLLPRYGKKTGVPVMVIMFGIILSTLHQSSLGSLFLLVPDKLSHFWWSPRLPINFLISAVAIGLSVVIVERTITSRMFKRPLPADRLIRLSSITAGVLWLYLAFRLLDVFVEMVSVAGSNHVGQAYGGGVKETFFLIEIFFGGLVPAIMLTYSKIRRSPYLRCTAAVLIILGVLFNRLNVTFIGMNIPGVYIPSLIEILISVATLAAIIFLYSLGIKLFPIYTRLEPPGPDKNPDKSAEGGGHSPVSETSRMPTAS